MPRLRPYLVCGIDVYRTEQSAKEDNARLNLNQPLTALREHVRERLEYSDEQYFSGRYYAVLDQKITSFSSQKLKFLYLEELQEESYNSIDEIVLRLNELKASEIELILESDVLSSEPDATYILSPLTSKEISDLFKDKPEQDLSRLLPTLKKEILKSNK